LTDVEGVLDGAKQVRPRLTTRESEALIATGVATGGMQAKLNAALDALRAGVGEVRIASGGTGNILRRLLTGESLGTRIALNEGSAA
jgi:acetylglutamate kinase